MLGILLTILKIIGIILLVLLGIIVLFLLLLCVPIRYRAQGHKEEDYSLLAAVSWLLHTVHADIRYDSDGLKVYVRLFGFLVYPKKERKSNNKKAKMKRIKKKKDKKKKDKEKKVDKASEDNKPRESEQVVTSKPVIRAESAASEPDEHDEPDELEQLIDAYEFDEDGISKKDLRRRRRQAKKENKKNRNTKSLSDRYNSIVDKLKRIYNKYTEVTGIIDDPKVRHTASVLKTKLVQVLKHLLPRRIRGYVEYGFDDPATTGYVTAILGALYGSYGKSITISPDFENSRFACRGKMRGHVRLMTFILLFLNVILRPDCRYTYHLIKKALE